MFKFDFSIRNREGQKIDGIMIMGRDQEEAERKLKQMYRDCEVLGCAQRQTGDKQWQATSVEDIMTLISKEH